MKETGLITIPKDYHDKVKIFAGAFSKDKCYSNIFGSPAAYERFAKRIFTFIVKQGFILAEKGGYFHHAHGMLLSIPSPDSESSLSVLFRSGLIGLVINTPIGIVYRLAKFGKKIEVERNKVMPAYHQFLYALAVRPDKQRMGIGTELLTEYCEWLDLYKYVAYLETSSEDNVKLYEKFGFKVSCEYYFNTVKLWGMVRVNK